MANPNHDALSKYILKDKNLAGHLKFALNEKDVDLAFCSRKSTGGGKSAHRLDRMRFHHVPTQAILKKATPSMPDHQPALVLFDGICNFCNHAVQFILNRDPQGHFHFASLQSGLGQSTLKEYGLDGMNQESMVLIQKGKAFTQSTAALRIAAGLSLPWSLWAVFLVVPAILRDPLYRLIAKRRYRLFGKRETCMLPKPEWRHRFPENGP